MEWKEYKAKTVSDALTDALIELETTSDMIEYQVIEEGSTGILKLFSKDAVIRVRKKEIVKTVEEEKPVIKPEVKAPVKTFEKNEPKAAEKKSAPVKQKNIQTESVKNDSPKKKEVKENKEAKPIKESKSSAAVKVDNAVVDNVLKVIFEKLGIKADIEITVDEAERVMNVNIIGNDTGDIIGKRGQTLDAIQYIVSIIINKDQDNYYRVKLDTNNYRERRQKTLENLAKNVAGRVKKTRKKVTLEPMNPYERRVIHSYLQSDKFVTTKSEGEEPNRRVVIYYKKS